jgi:hypothetical protein
VLDRIVGAPFNCDPHGSDWGWSITVA